MKGVCLSLYPEEEEKLVVNRTKKKGGGRKWEGSLYRELGHSNEKRSLISKVSVAPLCAAGLFHPLSCPSSPKQECPAFCPQPNPFLVALLSHCWSPSHWVEKGQAEMGYMWARMRASRLTPGPPPPGWLSPNTYVRVQAVRGVAMAG